MNSNLEQTPTTLSRHFVPQVSVLSAGKMAEKKKAVSFTASDLSEGKSKKQPPTQKYDRKEIQKRLDIENWMDEELKRIYGVEVSIGSVAVGLPCRCAPVAYSP